MKNYMIFGGILLVAIVFSNGLVTKALTSVNGQYEYYLSPILEKIGVIENADLTGIIRNGDNTFYKSINRDPFVLVPKDVFIAKIELSNGEVNVKRFIDTSTQVACYYSEINNNGVKSIIPSCVSIKK